MVEACLSDKFSKYLILSLTIAFAASVFKVSILSLCLSSMAGRFIECSNFSAASCTSDFGLKTGPALALTVCFTTGPLLGVIIPQDSEKIGDNPL